MKATSTLPHPSFFHLDASHHRAARWHSAPRREAPAPTPESGDELARKQEIVCGAILALSSVSTVLLCLWQLAVS